MKEIVKLIRFDYITSRNSALPFFCGMLIISLLLAVFGVFNPMFNIFLIIACVGFFAPSMAATQKPEYRRVQGILPVSRAAFVRAEFAEYMLGVVASETITLILMGINKLSKLYEIFPRNFEVFCKEIHEADRMSFEKGVEFKFVHLVIFVSVLLIVQIAFIAMRSDIEKHQHDIRNVLLTFSLAILVFIVSIILVTRGIIPPYNEWLFPSTDVGTWIWGITLNAAAVALGILFCHITVKKTADYEV